MAKSTFTKTAASTKTAAVRKPRAKKTEVVTVNAAETLDAEFADLYEILGEGSAPEVVADAPVAAIESDVVEALQPAEEDELAAIDELLAPEVVTAPVETELSLDELETAVTRAEATDAMLAAAVAEEVPEGAAPTGEAAEPAAATDKPKRAAPVRKHYADKIERLKDRVGANLGEYTILTASDAVVEEELGAAMERTLDIIRAMNVKEKNRASNLIEFLSGKKAKLNEVLERVLRVLDRDGFLTTGNEGNVMKDLVARPYSPASARAMGGNTIGMYADLKLIIADGKGRFVANPESLLLMKANSMLGAAPVAAAAPAAIIDPTPEMAEPAVATLKEEDESEVDTMDVIAALGVDSAVSADPELAPF